MVQDYALVPCQMQGFSWSFSADWTTVFLVVGQVVRLITVLNDWWEFLRTECFRRSESNQTYPGHPLAFDSAQAHTFSDLIVAPD
jgi:hypothetical protein